MSFDFFTFDNGKDGRRVDYDQFIDGLNKQAGKSVNADLWRLFSIFDKNGNGQIDIESIDGEESEAAQLFGFIKRMAGSDEVLEKEEITGALNKLGIEFGTGEGGDISAAVSAYIEGLAEGTGVTYKDGRVSKIETDEGVIEYIYHDDEEPKCV